MAILFSGSAARQEESSPPQVAKAADIVIPVTPYDHRVAGFYTDTLFAVNPTDEAQVLRDGGVMNLYSYTMQDPAHAAEDNIASLVDFELSPGRNGMRAGTSYGHVVYDLHGCMPLDEWTVQVWVRCNTVDLNALALLTGGTTINLGSIMASKQNLSFTAVPGSPRKIRAQLRLDESNFLVAGSTTTLEAEVPLATGDFPADTWVVLTASYDSIYGLSLVVGGDSAPFDYWEDMVYDTSGLISAWSMDAGGSPETDWVGSNDGTYAGASVTHAVTGAIRGSPDPAVRFTAQNGGGYLDVGNDASLQLATGSIEFWLKVNNTSGGYSAGLVTKTGAYTVELIDNILYTYDYGASVPRGSASTPGDGTWHHIGMTFAPGASNTKLYVDGALVFTTTTSVLNQASSLKIGQPVFGYSSTNRQIDIDEVNVYSAVLDLAAMQARWAFNKPKFDVAGAFPGLRTWGARSDQLLGVTALGGPTGTSADQGVDATVPTVYRYSRYLQRQLYDADGTRFTFRAGPTLSVDVDAVEDAWTPEVAGVVDRNSATNDPTDPTAAAQFDLIEDAGVPLLRIAEMDELAPLTDDSPLTIDWTDFDVYMERLAEIPDLQIHAMAGYTPLLLRQGGNRQDAPTDNAIFAEWQSEVIGRMVDTHGLNIVSISFWNEPELVWDGTVPEFKALWLATAQQLADHPSLPTLGGPDCASEAATTAHSEYLEGVVDEAEANNIELPEVYLHSYAPSLTVALEGLDSVESYVAGKFTPECKVQQTEWGHREVILPPGAGANLFGAGAPGYSWEGNLEHQSRNVFEAAYAYAFMYELLERGTTKAAYYTMAQNTPSFPGLMSGITDGTTGEPRPFPVFWTFALMWKHAGDRVQADSTWPNLRGICTVADDGTITLTYGSLKRSKGLHPDRQQFAIEWDNLPASFSWKHWQLDEDTADTTRLLPIATGNEDNLPLSVTVGNLGVGCIQIT